MNKKYILVILIVLMLIACCCVVVIGFFGLSRTSDTSSSTDGIDPDIALTITAIVAHNNQVAQLPKSTPVPDSPDQTWLVMLYLAGDNNLEEELFYDLNEAEFAGSSSQVHIVAQFDRYEGPNEDFQGDGDWTTTKRFYIEQDFDITQINSPEIADLGEVDMSTPQALADFLSWAMTSYPADRTVLIMSNHGSGWLGGWQDDGTEGNMYPNDLRTGLQQGLTAAGVDRLDMIGFDACLMAQMEIASTVAPYARYMVASEEYELGYGWAYAAFLNALSQNPGMSPANLSEKIVDSFIAEDIAFGDVERAAGEIESQLQTQTLSAIDLDAYPALVAAFNDLAYQIQYIDQSSVASARSYAQSYDNIFEDESRQNQVPPSYIDVAHFFQVLQSLQPDDPELNLAIDNLQTALQAAVIAEKHGSSVSGSGGISVFFPNSTLYSWVGFEDSNYSYPQIASSFSEESLWDDFLSFHYTQQAFDPATNTTVLASKSASFISPGAGEIEFTPIQQTAAEIAANEVVTLSTQITGTNIAYIYTDIAYYWEEDGSFLTADMNYIWADETRELGGIYYPDWSDGTFTVSYEWEPVMFALTDGTNQSLALIYPLDYGPPDQPALYGVDGFYTMANGGGEYEATITFTGEGEMREIMGRNLSADGLSAPFQITPQIGDQFLVYQEWFENEEFVYYYTDQPLIYSGEGFTFEAYDADAGTYIIGFIVEDMEGNLYFSDYAEIVVHERE